MVLAGGGKKEKRRGVKAKRKKKKKKGNKDGAYLFSKAEGELSIPNPGVSQQAPPLRPML